MLTTLDALPDGFLTARPEALGEIVPGPTLIHLHGRRQPALFVSVLLHGNEPVGLQAIQRVLAAYGKDLPRSLSLFVGNVQAARENIRRLHDQPDYNRIWPGCRPAPCPEREMMADLVRSLHARGLFASVDIHNNTGRNPHYTVIMALDPPTLQLASLFSRTAIYALTPRGTQTGAFSGLCPAVTLECARPFDEAGVLHAAEFIDACLRLDHVPTRWPDPDDLHLFEVAATMRIPPDLSFGFGNTRTDVRLPPDLDLRNFNELTPGVPFAHVHPGRGCLHVTDAAGQEVTDLYFAVEGEHLVVQRTFTPSMLTLDPNAIRLDCLGYVMERKSWRPEAEAKGAG